MSSINKVNTITDLYNSAYLCKTSLDKDFIYSKNSPKACVDGAVYVCKKYMKQYVKNPVAAQIAMHQVVQEHPVKNQDNYMKNFEYIGENPAIEDLKKVIVQNSQNQKRTSIVRDALINNDKININYVTSKMSKIEKVVFKLKMLLG